ncbi:glycosyltransferase family 4 protein [Nakamurella multipartita]|uniref:Glycosyl transferase group 1 n=1 Tax=Nakamurella multipartita (strain ATCC 700099 / DSM 44233 / CIP 104796 / JCM 9543 / NBRC 105858 / Y-104) TaxID=479431 RepID=C8XIK6_NAKMY|nr:glycosyltransferase family 1 protein [Nakamurella multipartita]ACV80471.1 glycosyl transferase group 1 [Nakamurella multipartita DSM 44233]
MGTEPHVLLDATAIPADRGGVGRYVDKLAGALDAAGSTLSVVCQHRDAATFAKLATHSRIVPTAEQLDSRPARLAWEQTTLPRLARRLSADVLHSPHYTMPLAAPLPVVVTLHDATFFSDRGLHLGVKGRFFRAWTRTALRRSAVCVVPSRATKAELVRLVGADPAKLVVAHHGVDHELFRPPTDAQKQAAAAALGLGRQPWIGFLGTLEPRKNVPALIRGFVRAAAHRGDPPVLVLAGSPGWDAAIEPAMAAVPPGLSVIRPGHLAIEQLPGFLGGALVVAYPSLGEGFGLPVLEAMACGAPVLTTRRLSLPEVGGDAVAYSETGAGDIADALVRLLDQPEERARLAHAAIVRAGEFTWVACAQAHQRAYRLAASGAQS